MKKYIFFLFLIAACLCQANDGLKLQRDLPEPACRNEASIQDGFAPRLKKHLDAGDLVAFYKEARLIVREMPVLKADECTNEEYADRMWVIYYIANAPLFKTDFDPTWWYSFRDDDDISAKASLFNCIQSYVRVGELDRLALDNKIIRSQMMTYYAQVFKDFRGMYDPNIREKIEAAKEAEVNCTIEQLQILHNKCSIGSRRNEKIKSNLEAREEFFVETLVRLYPGKEMDVRKYIRMAGYTDDEMCDLIDRTVGRTGSTGFLYKGRYGRKHDKKTEAARKRASESNG